jgi:hypothetical protein
VAEDTSKLPPWIKALVGLAVLAALANGAMVWFSLNGHRDLVRSDYYQAGLEQDARMARRSLADGHGIRLTLKEGLWRVDMDGPEGAPPPAAWKCRISLQRPDDSREDRVVELRWQDAPGAGRHAGAWQGVGVPLRKGRYDILIEWEKDGRIFMETAFPRYFDE